VYLSERLARAVCHRGRIAQIAAIFAPKRIGELRDATARAFAAIGAPAGWIASQITEAFPWNSPALPDPRPGRDLRYCCHVPITRRGYPRQTYCSRLAVANSYAERLIGTIRLDRLIVLGAYLRRILGEFAAYCNESRTHRALSQDAPGHRAIDRLGAITPRPVLGGLHHQCCRI
jgi:hypothetical protein